MSNIAYGSITITDLVDRGITGTTEWYKISNNTTETFDTSTWTQGTILAPTANQTRLWLYEITTYSDGTTSTWGPVVIGTYGEQGAEGVGYVSEARLFYLKNNSTVAPDAPTSAVTSTSTAANVWTTKEPAWQSGYYYWTCHQFEKTDGTYTWTDVILDSALSSANETAAAAQTAATNATAIANSKSQVYYGSSDPANTGTYRTGDIWVKRSSGGIGGDDTWYYNGSQWVKHSIGTTTIIDGSIITDKIATGAVDANTLNAESINASKKLTVTAAQITDTLTVGQLPTTVVIDSDANSKEQIIYISETSGTSSVSANTTWVTGAEDVQNAWTTKRPTYNPSYPVLFVATQRQTVAQSKNNGRSCYCTTPVKDDTTTVIDGGHITTGTIDAARIAANSLSLGKLTEDAQEQILNTSAINTANGYTDSAITQSANSITTSVSQTYETKSDASSKLNTAKDYTDLVVGSIEIGGTNLLTGTNSGAALVSSADATWEKHGWRSAGSGSGTISAISTDAGTLTTPPSSNIRHGWRITCAESASTSYSTAKAVAQNDVPLTAGADYTISCYARRVSASDTDAKVFLFAGRSSFAPADNSGKIAVSSENWERYSVTFTMPETSGYISGGLAHVFFGAKDAPGGLDICGLRLESGNMVTDWDPAPEDIDSEITTIQSSIAQQANKIALVVTESSGTNVINSASIVTAINGDSSVTISADRIDLNGFVRISDLSTSGGTSINGDNISSGTIKLGGLDNGNGQLYLYDNNDELFASLTNLGLVLRHSSTYQTRISLGTTDSNDYCLISNNVGTSRGSHLHVGTYYGGTITVGSISRGADYYSTITTSTSTIIGNLKVGDCLQVGTSQWYPTNSYTSAAVYASTFYAKRSDGYGSVFADRLTVSGTKSRVVDTDDYSSRLLYCYETTSPMFGDIGSGRLDESGVCYVFLDSVFVETINSDMEYYVFLQANGNGELWVSSKDSNSFVVEGTPGLEFSWEVKVKQRDFEYLRLEDAGSDSDLSEQEPYERDATDLLNEYLLEMEDISDETINELH